MRVFFIFFSILIVTSYSTNAQKENVINKTVTSKDIKVGAECTNEYFPLIQGKNIAIVANQTSLIGKVHLVDSLLKAGIKVKKIFCPEHGFRGDADAGEKLDNYKDSKTGLPVISLYGNSFKPKNEDLKGIDFLIFDIQDVGVRFYTYISTMHYVMEACAENNVQFIVLDRPNPNGYFIDGPVLEKEMTSFVGMHPVPLVHGMTIAEYAKMINNEGWLKNGIKCKMTTISVKNYNHTFFYELPVKPSPNLPNMNAVYLYPSLGLMEGTVMSVGRGTNKPFQVIGNPGLSSGNYAFTPESKPGATNPPFLGEKCLGYDLENFSLIYVKNLRQIYLFWIMGAYDELKNKGNFFNPFFDKLAGTKKLREQIMNNVSEDNIRLSWQSDISKFKTIRKKYLLYPDFE